MNKKSITREEANVWICPDCQAAAKKGGDNSQTPVRPSTPGENVTYRANREVVHQYSEDLSLGSIDLKTLTSEIRLLRQEMSNFRSEFAAVVASLALCQNHLDEVSSKLIATEKRVEALEDEQKQYANLKATIAILHQRIENQAQSQLKNEIEIAGLEETKNENPYHLALTTASKIGVNIAEEDLENVTRAGPRRNIDEEKSEPNLPRPLVVRFTRKGQRDNFIKAAKSRRNLISKDIVGHGPERKVFINERLTRDKRLLFRQARKQALEADVKYCWVKNGSIYIRKRAGNPAICIHSLDELHRLLPGQSG